MISLVFISCRGVSYKEMTEDEIKKTIVSGERLEALIDKQSQFEVGPKDDRLYFYEESFRYIHFFVRGDEIYVLDDVLDRVKVFNYEKQATLKRIIHLPKAYRYMYLYKENRIVLFSRFKHCAIIDFDGNVVAEFNYDIGGKWDKFYFRNDTFYHFKGWAYVMAEKISLNGNKVEIKKVWDEHRPDDEDDFSVWPTEDYRRYVDSLEKRTCFLYRTKKQIISCNFTDEKTKDLQKYIIIIDINENKFVRFYQPRRLNEDYFTANPYPSMNIYATDRYYYFWTFKDHSGPMNYTYYLNRVPIQKLFEKFKDKVQKI